MRFLADECTGPAVASWLRSEGYEVFSVYEEARGLDDESIIRKAYGRGLGADHERQRFRRKIYREDGLIGGCSSSAER